MSNMCRKDVGGFYEPCKAGLREFLLERVRALKAFFNVIAGQSPSYETTDSDRGTILRE